MEKIAEFYKELQSFLRLWKKLQRIAKVYRELQSFAKEEGGKMCDVGQHPGSLFAERLNAAALAAVSYASWRTP